MEAYQLDGDLEVWSIGTWSVPGVAAASIHCVLYNDVELERWCVPMTWVGNFSFPSTYKYDTALTKLSRETQPCFSSREKLVEHLRSFWSTELAKLGLHFE